MQNEDLKKADRLIGSLTLQHDQACKKIAELEVMYLKAHTLGCCALGLFAIAIVALAICLFA